MKTVCIKCFIFTEGSRKITDPVYVHMTNKFNNGEAESCFFLAYNIA